MMHEVLVVPENKSALDLLRDFQSIAATWPLWSMNTAQRWAW